MDPHLPFLKAIVANRHDDLPRLVYADFLEETGDPPHLARAHFIRLQVHLESADPKSWLTRTQRWESDKLLELHGDAWQPDLPGAVWRGGWLQFDTTWYRVRWRRGFPDGISDQLTVNELRGIGVLLRELPFTSLRLWERSTEVNFNHFAVLAELATLSLNSFAPLVASPDEPTPTFRSLLSARVFTSLRHLDLGNNDLTDPWIVRFAAAFPNASFAPALETLDLSRNFGITDAGANVLATSAAFDRLKRLIVKDTGIGKSGMSMLRKRFGNRLANGAP